MNPLPPPADLLAVCAAVGTAAGAAYGLLLGDKAKLRDEIIAWGTLGGIVGTIVALAIVGGGALAGVR